MVPLNKMGVLPLYWCLKLSFFFSSNPVASYLITGSEMLRMNLMKNLVPSWLIYTLKKLILFPLVVVSLRQIRFSSNGCLIQLYLYSSLGFVRGLGDLRWSENNRKSSPKKEIYTAREASAAAEKPSVSPIDGSGGGLEAIKR